MANEPQDTNNGDKRPTSGPPRIGTGIGALVLVIILVTVFLPGIGKLLSGSPEEISYDTFKQQIVDDNMLSVTVEGDKITGVFKSALSGSDGSKDFLTYLPSFGDPDLLASLTKSGVTILTRPANQISLFTILINVLPFVLIG